MSKPDKLLKQTRYLPGALLLIFLIVTGAVILNSPGKLSPDKPPPPKTKLATTNTNSPKQQVMPIGAAPPQKRSNFDKTTNTNNKSIPVAKQPQPAIDKKTAKPTQYRQDLIPSTTSDKPASKSNSDTAKLKSVKGDDKTKKINSVKNTVITGATAANLKQLKKPITMQEPITPLKSSSNSKKRLTKKTSKTPNKGKKVAKNKTLPNKDLPAAQPIPKKDSSVARVTSLTNTDPVEKKEQLAIESNLPTTTETAAVEITEDYIETAFDLFVGGNYFGFVLVKYNDNWIELLDPQEAIYLLPLIRNRQEMLPLFQGRILKERTIDKIGTITIDNNNFAINVSIAPEQALDVSLDVKKTIEFEGSPTFLTRFAIKGNRTIDAVEDESRFSGTNNTRFAYNQHRITTSGVYDDVEAEYKLKTLQAETDFALFDTPLTLTGGLLDTPGQMFASSLDIIGTSLSSNRNLYIDDPLLSSNELEVFVPTRALVEVFKNDAETGEVLFSRMLEFGHTQIDTRNFPRGSYPVIIIVSVDGVELSRYEEQFYKYGEIMPRERLDINLTYGKFRDNLEFYNIPIWHASIRARINSYLEGNFSIYKVADRMMFSQGIKGVYQSKNLGEFNYELNISESTTKALLGYQVNLRWKILDIYSSITYTEGFKDLPVISNGIPLLNFTNRQSLNFSMSRNIKVFKRSINLSFKGRYRNSEYSPDTYRYGPGFRFTPYSGKYATFTIAAQRDWTESITENRMQLNLTCRLDPVTASSFFNRTEQPKRKTSVLQHSVQYKGNKDSLPSLRNITAKVVYTTNTTSNNSASDTSEVKTTLKNGTLDYKGSIVESGMYINTTSGQESGNIGGEVTSTFVTGANTKTQMKGSVPIGSAIVAITLNGEPDSEKLIRVLINGNHKAYINIGETTFIEAPMYKESKIEIRDATPKKGAFIKIVKPITTVTPYPGNILSRSFDVARLVIISGSLFNADGTPVANLFFETGSEASYTTSEGEFIVEMPIRANEKEFDFLVRDQICTFEIPETEKDILIEVGKVKCQPGNESELKLIRSIHDETRVY